MNKKRLSASIVIFALLLSGCSGKGPESISDTSAEVTTETSETFETSTVTETTTSETTKKIEPMKFNPHVHTDLMSEVVTDDMWESFYNLIDALRKGEDTFACSSEQAYAWCFYGNSLNVLYPPANLVVNGTGYEDGVGKFEYEIGKEEYLKRDKAFEAEIVKIMNEAVRSDYSDFEKIMSLYDYMCKNWVYDYEDINGQDYDDFGSYACLMKRNGICVEVAYAFTYLLLQAGVEATPFGTEGEHDWSYVKLNGKGYHVDPTWGLHGESPDTGLNLEYFMMTEEERSDDGLQSKYQAEMLWMWKEDYDIKRFAATDETFKPLKDGGYYIGMDTEKNIIEYTDFKGDKKEFSYGDL
ncbi:MAG: transglutaminase-like domain-containing protein [Saccharofermentans sp.]|nr:transglutaminase-like domain-containing protein [Saccharofermentans sp.]